jgi:hypothetical protein
MVGFGDWFEYDLNIIMTSLMWDNKLTHLTFTVGIPGALMDGVPGPSSWKKSLDLYGACNRMLKEISGHMGGEVTGGLINLDNEKQHPWPCKIWGFHGGDYEELCPLGCYAVWLL